jgi:hypothetical protein
MDLPVGMRYSTSALARSESSDWDPADFSDASTLQPISSFTDMSDTIPSPSQTSDIPNPGWNPLNRCAHFTVLETFTELVRDDPINAFLSLATITDERLALITPEHIDKLYTPVVKASPRRCHSGSEATTDVPGRPTIRSAAQANAKCRVYTWTEISRWSDRTLHTTV